jgi:crossover junction endodeoxyribonuclease RusA
MTARIRFLPPAKTINANHRTHWRVKAELTRTWRQTAFFSAKAERLGQLGRCQVRVFFPVRDSRRRDPANWHPTVKPIIDGLVDAGVWPDDTPEWVEVMEPRFYRTGTDVVVELTEVDAPAESVWPNGDERELGLAKVRALKAQRAELRGDAS